MNSVWLKQQFLNNPKKSKAALARALNLDPTAISKMLKGTRQIKAQEYILMCEYFGLEVNGSFSQEASYLIKPFSNEGSYLEEGRVIVNDKDWVIPAEVLKTHTDAPPENIRIFEVCDTFMEPSFRKGEHVLIDQSNCKPSPPGIFIISDGFGYFLRQCEFVPKSYPPQVRISAEHSSFQSQEVGVNDIDILGRIIAKIQWM